MTWPNGSGLNAERARILTALYSGRSDIASIGETAGIPPERVQTHLTNMQEQHKVRRSGGLWYPCGACALEKHWAGVRPIDIGGVRDAQ
jgi:DNA-binding IclR family transcriptional regulator